MNKRETGMVMAILQAAFPAYYRGLSQDEAISAVKLWTEMFADDDVADVLTATKALIATQVEGYPPTIGKVKDKLFAMKCPDKITEFEAWGMVSKAVRNSIYHSDEEFEKLPEIIRRIVGTPNLLREWAMVEIDSLESVVASNFMRSYRARAQSEREYQQLPESLRQNVKGLTEHIFKRLPEGDNKERGAV